MENIFMNYQNMYIDRILCNRSRKKESDIESKREAKTERGSMVCAYEWD